MRLVAQPLIGHHAYPRLARSNRNLLRPDTDTNPLVLLKHSPRALVERAARKVECHVRADRQPEPTIRGRHIRLEQVHRRLADKACHEQVRRSALQFLFTRELLEHAVLHHGDAVGERTRFCLIMRDEDRGHAALGQQALDPPAQHGAQLRLELSHRLVEQIKIRVADQRPRQRYTLLLAARDRARIHVERILDLDQPRDRIDTARGLAVRKLLRLQRKGDVLANRERRVERVALEGHRNLAPGRRQFVDAPLAQRNRSRGHAFKTCNHAQGRGLAAARGPQERYDLALSHFHIECAHGVDGRFAATAVDFVDIPDFEHAHCSLRSPQAACRRSG